MTLKVGIAVGTGALAGCLGSTRIPRSVSRTGAPVLLHGFTDLLTKGSLMCRRRRRRCGRWQAKARTIWAKQEYSSGTRHTAAGLRCAALQCQCRPKRQQRCRDGQCRYASAQLPTVQCTPSPVLHENSQMLRALSQPSAETRVQEACSEAHSHAAWQGLLDYG